MNIPSTEAFKVGEWLVEPSLLQISKEGEVRKLESRSMEILLFLVSSRGKVVSKQELHDAVWGDIYVTDNALTRAVSRLRKAFDDDPLNPVYIDTISKTGYRLIAPVVSELLSESIDISTKEKVMNNKGWIWGAVLLLIITSLSVSSLLIKDTYSEFHTPVPISTLIGPEVEPSISANGKKIAFTYAEPGANNMDVYIKVIDDQSQIKFTDLESQQGFGTWSPDGEYIAYVSTENNECGVYKELVIGGSKTKVGNCFSKPKDFVWSPDGSIIAFSDGKTQSESRSIYFIDLEKNTIEAVTSPIEGISGDHDPEFTPNGQYLVFNRKKNGLEGDLFKMNIETKELTQHTFDKATILGLTVFDQGKQIAFSSNRGGQRALWKISFAGGNPTRFPIGDRIPTHPRFAAKKKRLIYKSNIDQTHLWLSEKDAPARSIVASSRAELHPSLSNDGEKVVFISDRSGTFEIWASALDDMNAVKYTSLNGSFVNMPSWSPDDREIVFDARIGEDNAVYIIDVASKTRRTFVDLDGDQVNARFSRDGKYIYFASNHTGEWEIWKKSVLEDAITQVTTNGGYHLQEGLNGEFLYYTKNDTTGIWKMKKEGERRETQIVSEISLLDWGSWVLTEKGIAYISRSGGEVVNMPYQGIAESSSVLYKPEKPVQIGSPTLTVTKDGSKLILAQIVNREDEIMMVDFD